MIRYLIITTIICWVSGFSAQNRAEKAIVQAMKEQEQAWNTGDIHRFMVHYWNSEQLMFIGSGGLMKGWRSTLDRYLLTYPTPAEMGILTFNLIQVRQTSRKHATVVGQWSLKRATDNPSGYFVLLWEKINQKWVIIADHTS